MTHLTNFSFEVFMWFSHKIPLLFLYHDAKRSKMTKAAQVKRGSCLRTARQSLTDTFSLFSGPLPVLVAKAKGRAGVSIARRCACTRHTRAYGMEFTMRPTLAFQWDGRWCARSVRLRCIANEPMDKKRQGNRAT